MIRVLSLVGFLLIAIAFNHSFARSIFNDNNRSSGEHKFNPFFKTEGPEDLPSAPELNEFDRATLEVCGVWSNVPSNVSFMSVLNEADMNSIYDELEPVYHDTTNL